MQRNATDMRVATYYNNNDIRIEEMPRPRIGPGEVLVKVMASGICGSDVMEWYRIKSAPRVLGHEIAGEIIETGEGVDRFSPGDRIAVTHHVPCNTCKHCLAGKHTLCHTLHTTNFDPGGFAEYLRVPKINVDRGLFKLPDDISYDEGTFIEPLGCVFRGQRTAGVEPGKAVLVLGSGISGLLHISLARALGAGLVAATDVSPHRLSAARRFGADIVFNAADNVPTRFKDVNDGRLADVVIICTGAYPVFAQSLECVEAGGVIHVFAPSDPDKAMNVPINDFWTRQLTINATYAAARVDLDGAISLIRRKRIPVQDMVTHKLPLDQTAAGFRLVAKAEDSIKVIIEPHG